MRIITQLALLLPLFLSCSDHTIVDKGIGPRAMVYPENIDFGHHEIQRDSSVNVVENFVVFNTGDEELSIQNITLTPNGDNLNAFSIGDFSDLEALQPGDSYEFSVEFTPENYEIDGGIIEIWTDADAQTEGQISGDYLVVNLAGYGDAPDLKVEPESLDFGDITVNCDDNQTISLRNEGNIDLEIYGLDELISSAFPGDFNVSYGTLPAFPWVIMPGGQVDFWIEFRGDHAYVNTDSVLDIKITSNDIDEPEKWVGVDAYNEQQAGFSETFIAEENSVVDIIFVVDDSGSMHHFQQKLSNEMSQFAATIAGLNADFRIGVITTTTGTPVGWTESTSVTMEQDLMNLVIVGIGGSGWETGLMSLYDCMFNSTCNTLQGGWMRPDARMAVVFISDEPDNSPHPWGYYQSIFDQMMDPGRISMHGIIGPQPSGCQGTSWGISAQAGHGYHEIINHYQGQEYSICDDNWGVAITTIATDISRPLRYPLSENRIDETTIEVFINGQQAASREWTWDAPNNSVLFTYDAAPEPGDTVVINYEVGSCF